MHVLLDKIAERLAFERSGVRLYDAALLKIGQLDRLPDGMTMAALQEIRDEEAAHFRLLADTIERLGGDSTAMTPCADVTGVQGMGLLQAMSDPRTTLVQALDMLLAAQLIDNASWELLVELAEGFGLDEIADGFCHALAADRRHETLVRSWLATALKDVSKIRRLRELHLG